MRHLALGALALLVVAPSPSTTMMIHERHADASAMDADVTRSLPPNPPWAAELSGVEAAVRRTLRDVEAISPVE